MTNWNLCECVYLCVHVSQTKCNSSSSNVILCIGDRKGGRREGVVDEDGDGAQGLTSIVALEPVNVVQTVTANIIGWY